MTPQLKQYLNRSILVSIPALYEDGKCRAYTLRGFGTDGLWLNSEALHQRLRHENDKSTLAENPLVFVPYAQIAGIIFATVTPATPAPPRPQIGDEMPAAVESPSRAAAAPTRVEPPAPPPITVETPAAATSASPPAAASTKVEPPAPPPIPVETPAAANSASPPAASTKAEPPAPPPIPVETPAAENSPSPPAASAKGRPPPPAPIPTETPAAENSASPPAAAPTKVQLPAKRSKSTS
jgi:hypothetical protein